MIFRKNTIQPLHGWLPLFTYLWWQMLSLYCLYLLRSFCYRSKKEICFCNKTGYYHIHISYHFIAGLFKSMHNNWLELLNKKELDAPRVEPMSTWRHIIKQTLHPLEHNFCKAWMGSWTHGQRMDGSKSSLKDCYRNQKSQKERKWVLCISNSK